MFATAKWNPRLGPEFFPDFGVLPRRMYVRHPSGRAALPARPSSLSTFPASTARRWKRGVSSPKDQEEERRWCLTNHFSLWFGKMGLQ